MNEDLSFSQPGPRIGNQYLEDTALGGYLKTLTGGMLEQFETDLIRFGNRVVTELLPHHHALEREPPKHVPFDAWGRRCDLILTHPSWAYMHEVAAQENLVGLGYSQLPMKRVYQFTKLYLFSPSSGMYLCPLAMTDGAAALTRSLLAKGKDPELEDVYRHLTSSVPQDFWTAGQWMTEKHGGSDVAGGTRTVAKRIQGDMYSLHGVKWFTSAITSQVAYTLALVDGAIALFLVKVRKSNGELNGIQVVRLKEKLGTKPVPTAELILNGTEARILSRPGEGIKKIIELVNITRLYNSISAVGSMRRITALARDYAHRREVTGQVSLAEIPLHLKTLADMELRFRGALLLTLFTVSCLDKVEAGTASAAEKSTLRLLTPVTKLYTAKEAMAVVSEGLECFGGLGYMENSNLPPIERDAQVLSIWEGTTNVLSLDTIRALVKAREAPLASLRTVLVGLINSVDRSRRDFLVQEIDRIAQFVASASKADVEFYARDIAFAIAKTTIGALLAWHSQKEPKDSEVFEAWVQCHMPWKLSGCGKELTKRLALDLDDVKLPRGYGDVDSMGAPRPRF